MTTDPSPQPDRGVAPSVAEVAALTRRLRDLTAQGRPTDPAERAAFLADKDALIDRITAAEQDARAVRDRSRAGSAARYAARQALSEAVRSRAEDGGYVLVGPSARTWRRDPDTGRPTEAVSDAEHQAVRDLLGREQLDTTEPVWVTGPDGYADVHVTVHVTEPDLSDDSDDYGDDDAGRASAGDRAGSFTEPAWTLADRWDRRLADPDTRTAIGAALDRAGSGRPRPDDVAVGEDPWADPPPAQGAAGPDGDAVDREFDELIERHPLPEYQTGAGGRGWWPEPDPVDTTAGQPDPATVDPYRAHLAAYLDDARQDARRADPGEGHHIHRPPAVRADGSGSGYHAGPDHVTATDTPPADTPPADTPAVEGRVGRGQCLVYRDARGGEQVDPVDRARHAVDALPEPDEDLIVDRSAPEAGGPPARGTWPDTDTGTAVAADSDGGWGR